MVSTHIYIYMYIYLESRSKVCFLCLSHLALLVSKTTSILEFHQEIKYLRWQIDLSKAMLFFYLSLVRLYVGLVWQEIGGRIVEEEEQERDQPTHSSPGRDRTQEVQAGYQGNANIGRKTGPLRLPPPGYVKRKIGK